MMSEDQPLDLLSILFDIFLIIDITDHLDLTGFYDFKITLVTQFTDHAFGGT